MTKSARDSGAIEKIKESIIESAVEIISADGYASLTMRSLAERLGMSATNLYNYFSNKDEIYLNILILGFKRLHDLLTEAVNQSTDPIERGKNFMRTYLGYGTGNYNYYEIMFSRSVPRYTDFLGTPLEEIAQIEMDFSNRIIELSFRVLHEILLARPDGGTDNSVQRMIAVWSLLHGMISLYNSKMVEYVTEKPEETYDKIVDDIMRFILG